GATRAESVAAALAEVDEQALVVIVHDAARPLVDEAVLERLVAPPPAGFDGAGPLLPVADPPQRGRDGVVPGAGAPGPLVAAQTPQAFLAPALRRALSGDLEGATDCASLVERAGGRVAVVDGDTKLLKVTTADDLALVESWL